MDLDPGASRPPPSDEFFRVATSHPQDNTGGGRAMSGARVKQWDVMRIDDGGDSWTPIVRDLPAVLSVEAQTLP
jgi:hypothetical protein